MSYDDFKDNAAIPSMSSASPDPLREAGTDLEKCVELGSPAMRMLLWRIRQQI